MDGTGTGWNNNKKKKTLEIKKIVNPMIFFFLLRKEIEFYYDY